jgi:hypothetical protein
MSNSIIAYMDPKFLKIKFIHMVKKYTVVWSIINKS